MLFKRGLQEESARPSWLEELDSKDLQSGMPNGRALLID